MTVITTTIVWVATFWLILSASACTELRQHLIAWFETDYAAEAASVTANKIKLVAIADGFSQITDIQFAPNAISDMVVLQKNGAVFAVNLQTGTKRQLAKFNVLTSSEQGLLGLAFHPRFAQNNRAFLNMVRRGKSTASESVILEVSAERDQHGQLLAFKGVRDIYRVTQPYQNHNAGGLAFGPDGYLYIGWGDGGWMDDPHGHGQNLSTALGAMLRIDIDRQTKNQAYAIPTDNPFVGYAGALPEIWAYGLRNPWRYSFAPDGRLIVADVGQNMWEEINIVTAGGNYGWNQREGRHCFPPDKNEACQTVGLIDPIWDYDRSQGQSITGGYVYSSNTIPELTGRYVFADFVSGRIWSLALPANNKQAANDVVELGKWPILISTFGWNGQDMFVADFGQGVIYKLQP